MRVLSIMGFAVLMSMSPVSFAMPDFGGFGGDAADAQTMTLENAVKEARETVEMAKAALRRAKEGLAELRGQKPLTAGDNKAAIESQLYTWEMAMDTREKAVRVAEENLKYAEEELKRAENALAAIEDKM